MGTPSRGGVVNSEEASSTADAGGVSGNPEEYRKNTGRMLEDPYRKALLSVWGEKALELEHSWLLQLQLRSPVFPDLSQ